MNEIAGHFAKLTGTIIIRNNKQFRGPKETFSLTHQSLVATLVAASNNAIPTRV